MRWSIEELIWAWRIHTPWNSRGFFIGFFRRFWKRLKLTIHWLLKGYVKESLWGLYDYLIDIFIYRLKALKNARYMSYPGDLGSVEEWNQILERLIKGFEIMKSEELAEDYPEVKSKPSYEDIEIKLGDRVVKATAFISNETPEETELIRAAGRRQAKNDEETLELFIKYFKDLWD